MIISKSHMGKRKLRVGSDVPGPHTWGRQSVDPGLLDLSGIQTFPWEADGDAI